MKKVIAIILIGGASGYCGAWLFNLQQPNLVESSFVANTNPDNLSQYQPMDNALPTITNEGISDDFVGASQISTKSVVYIKNISSQVYYMSFMDMFFGDPGRSSERISSGSGVFSRKTVM